MRVRNREFISKFKNAILSIIKSIAFFYLFNLIWSTTAKAQITTCQFKIDSLTENKVYLIVDEKPKIASNEMDLKEFVVNNFKWPPYYCGSELLIAKFLVTKEGKIKGIQILKKSVIEEVNQEFIGVLNSLPKLIPGICNNVPVEMEYFLPIKLDI